jgi:hypothetical protein
MSAARTAVLIGADPEVFLVDGDRIISAIGRVPGSKEEPHRTKSGWVQPDNVLAEFNIPPAASRDEFLNSIRAVMDDLQQFGQFVIQASHEYSMAELREYGPAAFTFGCDPDFNAWLNGEPNPRPRPDRVRGLRTAGGHIHVGAELAVARPLDVVRGMDILLGLPSVSLEQDTRRRSMYGGAGAFRLKSYGVEYRTLSNFWLKNDDLVTWAYDQTVRVVQEIDSLTDFASKRAEAIQIAINTSSVDLAADLLAEYSESNTRAA